MRIAYFDTFSGISGDMTLGALLACGGNEEFLRGELAKLKLSGWRLDICETSKNGIGATDVTVTLTEKQEHGRHLHHIDEILNGSELSPSIKTRAEEVFRHLAEAEAKVHQTTVDHIHFHEVGAVDAIVDIVGACVLLDQLGVEKVCCAPLPMGHGFVECMHGMIPLPAPATLELLSGVPVYSADVEGELVTPTGAALMRTLAGEFGLMPAMRIEKTGYGSGKKDFGNRPNLLRIVVGEAVDNRFTGPSDITVIEVNLDDFSPQFYEPLTEHLMASGALDVYLTPVQMKKGRPAMLVTVVSPPECAEDMADILFRETPTLGIRHTPMRRLCLDRTWRHVETPYGAIRIKVGSWKGSETTASPEFEDLKTAAEKHGVPVKCVFEAAMFSYRRA